MLTAEELILEYLAESQANGADYAHDRFRQRLAWGVFDPDWFRAELQAFEVKSQRWTRMVIGMYLLVVTMGVVGGALNFKVLFSGRLPERLQLIYCLIVAAAVVLSVIYVRYAVEASRDWRRRKMGIEQLYELIEMTREIH